MSAAILIVDDSLTVRMDLMETLGAAGLEAATCASVAAARQALAAERFPLIILDVLLPDGDGIELLREIRGTPATRDIAVILLSTEAEVKDRVRGIQTGAGEYVGKPYEPSYLVARARELRRRGFETVSERVETRWAMMAALEQPWDMVISDWAMPHFSAGDALAVLQETKRDLPFIIVSGTVGEEAAVAALRAGAHDFMAKGRLPRLIPAIEREMREAAGRAERRVITILKRTLGGTINITTRIGGGLWETRIDPSQVENALLNLAINARDAMPNGAR